MLTLLVCLSEEIQNEQAVYPTAGIRAMSIIMPFDYFVFPLIEFVSISFHKVMFQFSPYLMPRRFDKCFDGKTKPLTLFIHVALR